MAAKGYTAVPVEDSGKADKSEGTKEPSRAAVMFAIGAYATCSSTMLVVNKLAVHFLPAPSIVLFAQLVSSAVAVKAFDMAGLVVSEKLEWEKAKKFLIVALAFLGTLFTNVKTLQYANVETFIVFRSSTPIVTSVCDYLFLGRQLPSARSWASLGAILVGAMLYVLTDSGFEVKAYFWVAMWYVVFVFDQLYIKYVCDTVPMTSWGRVYYTNFLASLPVTFLGLLFREDVVIMEFEWTWESVTALMVSCLVGIGMSYSAFLLRAMVSATSFTVVGIMCKIATVVINCLIWDKHASPEGLAALAICLAAGTMYKQAPMREGGPTK